MIDIATTTAGSTAVAPLARSIARPVARPLAATVTSFPTGTTRGWMYGKDNAFHPARRRTERSSP